MSPYELTSAVMSLISSMFRTALLHETAFGAALLLSYGVLVDYLGALRLPFCYRTFSFGAAEGLWLRCHSGVDQSMDGCCGASGGGVAQRLASLATLRLEMQDPLSQTGSILCHKRSFVK